MGCWLRLGFFRPFYILEQWNWPPADCVPRERILDRVRVRRRRISEEDFRVHRVTVSSRGQIVIPAELRRKMGISAGTHLRLYESGSRVVLVPELADPVEAGFGFLRKVHPESPVSQREQA